MSRPAVRTYMLVALVFLAQAWLVAQQKAPTVKSGNANAQATLVNLNTATVQQLDTLPGIGATVAARIIEYRQKNGPFKKIEELMNVRGVGEKNFLKLKPQITVAAAKADHDEQH